MTLINIANTAIYDNNVDNPTDGELLLADLNTILNEVNAKEVRLANVESATFTFVGAKIFQDAVTLAGIVSVTGALNLARASDPGSPTEGMFWYNSTSHLAKLYNGTSTLTLATTGFIPPNSKGHIWGLTLSNNIGTPNTDIDIAAGQAMDDTNADLMVYAGGTKRLSATWVVGSGNGGSDTGTIPTSGTVHVFLIKRVDTGVVDVLTSTSLTPTLPSGYTLKRRIASLITDSSAHIVAFTQYGDEFYLGTPVLDVNVSNQGTSATLRTLSVPGGLNVRALLNVVFSNSSASQVACYIRNPDLPDNAPSITAAPLATFVTENNSATADYSGGTITVLTNIASQVTSRATAASLILRIATLGWIDNRGRFF